MVREIEDYFEGPSTRPKLENDGSVGPDGKGDGLGPSAVWTDEAQNSPIGNGSRIADDTGTGESYAFIPMNAAAFYAGEEVVAANSWAEIEFRALNTEARPNPLPPYDPNALPEYANIDVQTRNIAFGSQKLPYAYYAKIRKEGSYLGGKPVLIVGKIDAGARVDLVETRLEDISNCSTQSELDQLLKDGSPAILRIEVRDLGAPENHPELKGTIAWNCTTSGCDNACSITEMDFGTAPPTDPLWDKKGSVSFSSHHFDHRVDAVRGGSTNTQ